MALRVVPEGALENVSKKLDFQVPLDSENEALAQARAQFSLFGGDQKMN